MRVRTHAHVHARAHALVPALVTCKHSNNARDALSRPDTPSDLSTHACKTVCPPEQGKASMPMSLTPACRVKNRKWADLWRLLKTPDFIGVLTRFRLFQPSSAPRSVLKASKRRNPLYIAALRPFPRVFSGFHRVFYAPHQSPLKMVSPCF